MTSLNNIESQKQIQNQKNTNKKILKDSKIDQNNKSGVNLYLSKLLSSQQIISSERMSESVIDKSNTGSKRRVDFSMHNVQENHTKSVQSPPKSKSVLKKSLKSIPQPKNIQKTSEPYCSELQTSNFIDFSQMTCEDSQVQAYFNQFNVQPAENNIIHEHQQLLFSSLKRQLKTHMLLIEQTKHFPLKKKESKSVYQEERQIKQRLQQKRQQALMKIRQIEEQQLQLKRRVITTVDRPKRPIQLTMSRITQSIDQEQVKKAIQEYKKFTQQIQKRDEKAQLQRQQKQKLQQQKQQELLRLRRQSRREQVKNNLKQIIQRQRIRKSIMEEWKAKDKEIKQKKYLYIDFIEKDKKHQEIKEMQHQQFLDRLKKNHQFDKNDIEKHQKKYQQLLEQRKQMSRSLINSAVTHSSSSKKYQTSKFHEFVVKEMQEQKKKQLQKLMKVKEIEHKDKVSKYQQKIDSQIKPNLHYKKFVPIPRAMSLEALQAKDRWNLGLKYLQKAKKLKMPQTELKLLLTKRQEQDKLKQSRQFTQYKDYLKDIKKDIAYDPTERKLNQILRNRKSHTNYQTLKDAKYMSQYLVQKSKHSDQEKTILAIKKKMDILNVMY